MAHRGEIIKRAVDDRGITKIELARKLKKSRKWLYNLFENPSASFDIIMKIGKIIEYDFNRDFPELDRYYFQRKRDHLAQEERMYYKAPVAEEELWKDKYLQLLEEYNKLLKHVTDLNKIQETKGKSGSGKTYARKRKK